MKHKTTAKMPLKLLCLEDSPKDAEIILELLTDTGYDLTVDCIATKKDYAALLRANKYDIILSDFKLPGFDAFEALRLSMDVCPDVPFICISGSIGEEIAIELIKQGAVDYILKDRLVRLPLAIKRALDEVREKEARRRTEESLRDSEERYKKSFEDHSAVKLILDPDTGAILDANHAAVQYYGWSHKELTRMKIQQINTLSAEQVKAELTSAVTKNQVRFEFCHRRADGSIRDVEVFSSKIEIKGKKFLDSIVHDITERKQTEEKANRLAAIVQSSDDAIIGKTLDGIITSWNKGAEKIYGYTESEIIGKSISILLPEANKDEMVEILLKLREGKHVEHYETIRRSKAGRNIYMSLTVSPIFDAEGKIIAVSTIGRDITERKQTEERLIKNETLMQTAIENIPLIFYIIEPDGKFKLSIGAGLKGLGLEPNQVVGQSVFDVYHDFPGITTAITKALAGQSVNFESSVAESVFVNYVVPFSFVKGKLAGLVGVALDITERKRAEKALGESQSLYFSFIEQLPNAVFRKDREGRYVLVNSRFCTLKGLKRENFIGRMPNEVAADEKKIQGEHGHATKYAYDGEDAHELIMRTGKILEAEEEYPVMDGSKQYMHVVRMPVFDFQGTVIGTQGIMFDVTERKKVETALAAERNLMYTLINVLPDRIFAKDINRKFILTNTAHLKALGANSQEEVLGKTDYDFKTKEISDKYLVNDLKVLQHGESIIGLEVKSISASGGVEWTLTNKVPLRDAQGNMVGLVGSSHDITERKQIEEALIYERNLLKALMDNTPDHVYFKDIKSHFIRISKSHAERFGISDPAQAVGKADFDFFSEEHARPAFENEQEIIKTGRSIIDLEEMEKWPDGRVTWVSTSKIPLRDLNGQIIGTFGISRDITNRKQIEEALKESERTFATLISNLPGFVYRCTNDRDWTMEFVSEGCRAITGYAPEDFLNNKTLAYNSIIQDEYRELIWQKWQQALPKQEAFEDEYPILTINGETRWVWERGQGVFTKDGQLLYLEGFITDITDRKRIEEKNAEQAHLLDIALDAIIVRDMNDKPIFWNKAAEKLFGWTFEEAQSVDVHTTIAEEDILAYNKNRNELLQTGAWEGELHQRTKDGRSLVTFSRWTLVHGPQGKPSARLTVTHDITENKKAEEALRNSNAFNELLLQTLPFGMDIVDEQGTILFLNDNMKKLFGDNATGQCCWSMYKDDKKQCLDCPLRKGIEIGKFEILESANVFGGKIFQINHVGIMYQGKKAMLEVFVEVTEQRALQNQFLQAQKIQSIGTLAGGIAHDFNNILGIILAYSSFIEKEGADKKKIKESSAAINKAVERGAALVRQILTFARKTDVSFQSLNIPEFIQEIISMLEETFPKVIEIKKNIEGTIPVINADPAQMHQALLNLCVNARDAMPNGGLLNITVEVVEQRKLREQFTAASNERYVCIAVSDTGTGIDPQNKHRIFDPFFTTKEKGKGTGLGLSVVYGVMQTHHGFVHVESEEGKGTTFFLYLPIPHESEVTQRQDDSNNSEIAGGTEKILLVEDEEMLRSFVQELLESNGYFVYTAADGLEAITLYTIYKNEIDLVLTDIGLPKITGIEEFKKLREINPQVKILLASGFLEPRTKSELLDAGAKGFIQKPYVPNEILKEIRKILDESKR
jgi:PAS domain S-box-containing protein